MFTNDIQEMIYASTAMYVAGFPCTPYSCLHSHSEMAGDWQHQRLQASGYLIMFSSVCSFFPHHMSNSLEVLNNWDCVVGKCAGLCPGYRNGAGAHVSSATWDSRLHHTKELLRCHCCLLACGTVHHQPRYEISWVAIDPTLGTSWNKLEHEPHEIIF